MERADECLRLYYERDMDGEDRFKMLASFGRALRFLPVWAVSQAFDRWQSEKTHRPSPGDIVFRANEALKPLRDELAHRQKIINTQLAAPERITPEEAERIMRSVGFTAKRTEAVQRRRMARTESELYGDLDKPREPHWTETRDPDHPDMVALRAARDNNPLIQQARAAEAKRLEKIAMERDEGPGE